MELALIGLFIFAVVWLDNKLGFSEWLSEKLYRIIYGPIDYVLNNTPEYWHIPLAIAAALVVVGVVASIFL